MGLFLADERGHLVDVGSASRYTSFVAWAETEQDPTVMRFVNDGTTSDLTGLAKVLEQSKRPGLAQEIARAARHAIGSLTLADDDGQEAEA